MSKILSEFTTKLGVARKVPKSRIWIEGARLIEAGFVPGRYFVKEWHAEGSKVALTLHLLGDDAIVSTMPCKVSGKGDKPIIDITGDWVRTVFADFTHVTVTYYPGMITIHGAA